MKTGTLLSTLIFFCFTTAFTQSGILDPSFGTNGIVRANFGAPVPQWSSARQTLEASDKNLYIILNSPNGLSSTAVSKRFPNGALDSSYGIKGFSVTLAMYEPVAALQADEKIVIAGAVKGNYPDYKYYFTIMRLNTDGSIDKNFGNNGLVNNPVGFSSDPTALLIQDDGKIVVAGINYTGLEELFAVARYNPDGSIDNTFNGNGQSFPNFGFSYNSPRFSYDEKDHANTIVQQADGKLLVGGQVRIDDYLNPTPMYAIVRYNTNGTFDSSFGENGHRFITAGDGAGLSLGIQTDGKVIAGTYTADGSNSKFIALRFTTDGSTDSTFGSNGIGEIDIHFNAFMQGTSMQIQSDDKITMGSRVGDYVIVRFNQNGSSDNNFGSEAVVATVFGGNLSLENSIAIQQDGKIIASGFDTDPSNFETLQVARYNTDGSLDNTFDNDGKLVGTFVQGDTKFNASAVQSDGKVVAAGYTFNGTNAVFLLARYTNDGVLDNSFGLNGIQTTDITPGAASIVNSVAIQPDGKIVAAGEGNGLAVARYNSDGSLDNSFNGNGYTIINTISAAGHGSLALQADGKIVIGCTNFQVNSSYNFAVVRLNSNASLDTSFNHSGIRITNFSLQANSNSIAIQNDGKIVQAGTAYDSISPGSIRGFAIVRYNVNGSLDNSFGNNGQQLSLFGSNLFDAYCMAIQPDGKIVVAGNNAVARYKTNGQLDSSFNSQGFSISVGGTAVAINEDGKIALGGSIPLNISWGLQFPLGNFAVSLLNADGTPDLTFANNGVSIINVTTGTGRDGTIQSLSFGSNGLFAAGFGTTPGNIGVITKYLIVNGGPLPVTVVDFTASLKNKTTLLQWHTTAELNLSHFVVQRSADGNSFVPIITLPAKGSSHSNSYYSSTDMQPLQGINYYRLQLVDDDGSIAYTKIVKVNNAISFKIKLYPNPTSDIIYLEVNGNNENATIQLIDGTGKVINVKAVVLTPNFLYPLDLTQLSKGMYHLKIIKKSGNETLRFIKQ